MIGFRRFGRGIALAALSFMNVANASAPVMPATAGLAAESRLSIMSYNVHGLPWPLATRGADFAAIATRLRQLRAQGRQPHVIVLQEAFTDSAKAIGAAAGYRYAQFGPSAAAPAVAATAADRAFQAIDTRRRGEGVGKWVDSGLAIFSDYPIAAARRVAYPVCAGFDCLANKGALAVELAVPNLAQPVFVIDTHLNSKAASGVDRARNGYAYRRQLAVLSAFVKAVVPPQAALFVAGDFNVGRAGERRTSLVRSMSQPALTLSSTFATCATTACAVSDGADLAETMRRNKDWLLFRGGRDLAVVPSQLAAPFGRAADGSMLSDHIGIAAAYALSSRRN